MASAGDRSDQLDGHERAELELLRGLMKDAVSNIDGGRLVLQIDPAAPVTHLGLQRLKVDPRDETGNSYYIVAIHDGVQAGCQLCLNSVVLDRLEPG